MSVQEHNKHVVTRMLELVNGGQFDALDQVFNADFLDHGPSAGAGLAGLQRGLNMMHGALPDLHFGVDYLVAEENMVVIVGYLSATFTGSPLFGVASTGNPAKWQSIMSMRVVDGKIVERWVNADTWGMLQQTGVLASAMGDFVPPLAANQAKMSVAAQSATVQAQNKATARAFIEQVLIGRDVNAASTFFAPGGGLRVGDNLVLPDVIAPVAGMIYSAFPDYNATIEFAVAEGDVAVTRIAETGTHQGDYMGVAATGKEVKWSESHCMVFKDGKIQELWMLPDVMAVMQQLGGFHPQVPVQP